MSNIWAGADPTGQADTGHYELSAVIVALQAVTLTGIRVWAPSNALDLTSRRGHVWAMNGSLLDTITMTDHLASGWTTFTLDTPRALAAGQFVVISYETGGNYGAVSGAFTSSVLSSDGAMMFAQSTGVAGTSGGSGNGRFSTSPGSFPDSSFGHTFYGVDAVYSGAAGGTAPTVTAVTMTGAGLDATVSITATDPEGLSSATYLVDWGDGQTSTGSGTSYSHTYATAGIKTALVKVTDATGLPGYGAASVELFPLVDGLDVAGILDAIVSHAMAAGLFERVNQHEPKNAPGNGITAAVWADRVEPVRSSGLEATSARVVFVVRVYQNMLTEPQDGIDPAMLEAVDALMAAYSGDFTLGGYARQVDLLGAANGPALSAQAGYVKQDERLFRVITITLPVIVNDAWAQSA